MNYTDDFDFFLTHHPHGWSTCCIHLKDRRVEFTISHAFGDPFFDLMKSLSQLIDKHDEVTFFWFGEPGGQRVQIKRIKNRHHMIKVNVDVFYESYGDQIKRFEKAVEFELKEKQLITLAYYQLKKIETLLREKSYAADRRDFPFSDFTQLENKVKSYLGLGT